MPAQNRSMIKLLQYDWWVASNVLKSSLAKWLDRLTVALGIPIFLLVGHGWISSLPIGGDILVSAMLGFVISFSTARFAVARIDFHRTVGLLAAHSLRTAPASYYLISVVGIGYLGTAALIALLDLRGFAVSLAAMAGGSAAGLIAGFFFNFSYPWRCFGTTFLDAQGWLKSPMAGFGCAILTCVLSVSIAATNSRAASIAITGLVGVAVSFALATVDAATVRFMTQSGISSWKTLELHARPLAAFASISVPISVATIGIAGAGILALIVIAMLLILTLRVLAYRVHAKRLADWYVSMALGAIGLATISAPVALPVAIGAAIWWLWRRARSTTWLIG